MLKKSVTGIEPATLGLEVPRAIQLRHTDPIIIYIYSLNTFTLQNYSIFQYNPSMNSIFQLPFQNSSCFVYYKFFNLYLNNILI